MPSGSAMVNSQPLSSDRRSSNLGHGPQDKAAPQLKTCQARLSRALRYLLAPSPSSFPRTARNMALRSLALALVSTLSPVPRVLSHKHFSSQTLPLTSLPVPKTALLSTAPFPQCAVRPEVIPDPSESYGATACPSQR
jgi:hypothetical protein